MKTGHHIIILISAFLLPLLFLFSIFIWYFSGNPWGFARLVTPEEHQARLKVVNTATTYLGCNEQDGTHKQIISIYNSHTPLAQDYEVLDTDSWCAVFVSAVAIECNLTDIIPTECGCERQIKLLQELNSWMEKDTYLPLPGDIIYYAWEDSVRLRDCTGWADHVGIVVGTAGPFIKVIEGNHDDQVAYRYISIFHPEIRGYGLPNYLNAS